MSQSANMVPSTEQALFIMALLEAMYRIDPDLSLNAAINSLCHVWNVQRLRICPAGDA